MEQRINFITLGVIDLDLMKNWYIKVFGWQPLQDEDNICFFKLNGLILALYPADALAEDIGVNPAGKGFNRFTLSMNLRSEEEVARIMHSLEAKGARIICPPEKVFWGGYRGYIADPEQNYWEFAYNPFMPLDDAGNIA